MSELEVVMSLHCSLSKMQVEFLIGSDMSLRILVYGYNISYARIVRNHLLYDHL